MELFTRPANVNNAFENYGDVITLSRDHVAPGQQSQYVIVAAAVMDDDDGPPDRYDPRS